MKRVTGLMKFVKIVHYGGRGGFAVMFEGELIGTGRHVPGGVEVFRGPKKIGFAECLLEGAHLLLAAAELVA